MVEEPMLGIYSTHTLVSGRVVRNLYMVPCAYLAI